jgi:hypothetical protein
MTPPVPLMLLADGGVSNAGEAQGGVVDDFPGPGAPVRPRLPNCSVPALTVVVPP